MSLTYRELSTILAALNNWHGLLKNKSSEEINNLTQSTGLFDDVTPLNCEEISALCEKLNCDLTVLPKADEIQPVLPGLVEQLKRELYKNGKPPSGETKLIAVHLVAQKRYEYTEDVAVPAEFTDDDCERLVGWADTEVDASWYTEDNEYWESADNRYELL